MQYALNLFEQIHQKALEASARYRRAEAEIIEILQQADLHFVYMRYGQPSLFQYVVQELGLSESVAYNLITVCRKAYEVPALKTEIENGNINLSNARKVSAVLTPENQTEWLEKARTLSHRELEREIVKVRPEAATPERTTFVTPTRLSLQLGLFESDLIRLRRAQDLLSQSKKRTVTLEETLIELTREYLDRHDPIEKAKRQKGRENPSNTVKTPVALQAENEIKIKEDKVKIDSSTEKSKRIPIPSAVLHQVNLRDQRRCTHVNSRGERCNRSRWIEIHHKVPVSLGGTHDLDNLITLCSAHHDWIHRSDDS